MPQVGDTVRYLNAVGGGTIVKIKDNIAYVDEDGFETPVLLRECVVVAPAKVDKAENAVTYKPSAAKPSLAQPQKQAESKPAPASMPAEEFDDEETDYGDKPTIVLGIEALDLTHIGESGYEASLVNDSNYYLYFTWLTRADIDDDWTARYAGTVEPNIQVILGQLSRNDVAQMENMAIQLIAYKRSKAFTLQAPVSVEIKVDTTKFFKVHCFRNNTYFDSKVLTFDIVRDGVAASQRDKLRIDPHALEQSLKEKQRIDRPQRRRVQRRPEDKNAPLVVDLHINELVDTTRGLSNADMLNLQIDTFRKIMDQNLRNHGKKIIFIHGKGEGVLRQALYKELNYRYKGHDVADASFREYGFGATQVTIR